MDIFGLYGFESAGLYGSGTPHLMKSGGDIEGECYPVGIAGCLGQLGLLQRTQLAGKMGMGRESTCMLLNQ